MKQFASVARVAADITSYCEMTLRDEAAGAFRHWEQSLRVSRENLHKFPLKSFEAMVTLYENLVEGVKLRTSVAQQWLASQE